MRELAGIASYDLMSVQTIVLWAMVVNAPVSLVTGVLFPVACRWIEQTDAFPVSRVYILEAVGSFAGGLAVTALLSRHVPMVRVFLLLALVLASSRDRMPVLASFTPGWQRQATDTDKPASCVDCLTGNHVARTAGPAVRD